jgi:hypothetical protein
MMDMLTGVWEMDFLVLGTVRVIGGSIAVYGFKVVIVKLVI